MPTERTRPPGSRSWLWAIVAQAPWCWWGPTALVAQVPTEAEAPGSTTRALSEERRS